MSYDHESILESFDLPLPDLGLETDPGYKSAGSSGASTEMARPPLAYIAKSAELHLRRADSFLRGEDVVESLKATQISDPCPELRIENESGVVSASLVYIIMPLLAALRVHYPAKFEVTSEESHSELYTDDESRQTKKVVRTDLVIRKWSSVPKQGQTIAIIEYKRREVVHFKDYAKSKSIFAKNGETKAMNWADTTDVTRLTGNALAHGKQLCTYASRTVCKHVALFNWDHLLLVDFFQLKLGMKDEAGDLAYLTWVTEKGQLFHTNIMEKALVRKVLLGWLLMAFKEAYPDYT